MERRPCIAACMSAVWPRLVGKSTLAPRFTSILTISRWPMAAAEYSRVAATAWPSSVVAEQSASTEPPLPSHLATFCSSPCLGRLADLDLSPADSQISLGSEVEELTAGVPADGGVAGATAGCRGAACCPMSSAVAGWSFSSVHCGAVWSRTSSSWVVAPASSRAYMHPSI